MTPLDDDQLRQLLHTAGDAVEPPADGVARVLASAVPSPAAEIDAPAPRRRVRHTAMPLKVAASVVALTAVAGSVTAFTTRPASRAPEAALGVNGGAKSVGRPSGAVQSGVTQSHDAPTRSTTRLDVVSGSTSSAVDATKIVATGTVSLTVRPNRVRAALARISVDAVHDLGYVANSDVHTSAGGNTSSATIVLRVPEVKFSSLVAAVQRVGAATSVVTSTANVTGQYVDYVSRIKALEASRHQYLAILARASSIPSILAVQAQINQIQSQIDQLAGQRNLLVNEAAYATVSVAIDQGPATPQRGSGLLRSVRDSIGGFVSGAEWLVRAAGPALFALLCLLALWLVSRTGWRTARRRLL